ncbi:MAG: glycosyltransferase family 4 protein [Acidobacteria bacterium]|nr:glycosyltransferase family 4 protein [Acidobacteriota bacterium]
MAERRLHLAVDGRELVGYPTGVGRYLWNVLHQWTVAAPIRHRISVILPREPGDAPRRELPTVDWHVAAGTGGTLWEQTSLRRVLKRIDADVLFAVGYTAPLLTVCPFVVVTHDVSFMAHPEWFGWREGLRRRLLTSASARAARTVLTVSEFSAAEIVRHIGIPRARLRLASPGAPAIVQAPPLPSRERIVLFVGSIFNRRRVPTLIDAFAKVSSAVPDARLVLVGDNRTMPAIDVRAHAALRGVAPRVDWRQYVTDDDLQRLYASARVFAFLSEYEGFAMTPMEAIAHGVPAVLLDTPVAREIYGPGACLVPDDLDRISDALISLLTDDAAHAAALQAGRQRLTRYSWATTAAVVLDALEQAAAG